jgi:murein DD-endopeptidase MepM/ murein hydrolase activator NlpD
VILIESGRLPFGDRPTPPRLPAALAGLALAAVLAVAVLGATGALRVVPGAAPELLAQAPLAVPSAPAPGADEPPPLRVEARVVRVGRAGTFAGALADLGLERPEAAAVVEALRGAVDFGRVRPGDQLRLERPAGEAALRRLSYRQGPADEWIVEPGPGGSLAARRRPVEIATQVERVAVEIESSLYESLQRAGEDPALALLASDPLAWDVDFYQDVRAGDRMALLVEKVYADGRFLRLGAVRAVEYRGEVASQRLFLWTDPEGRADWYDDQGGSARRGFLRSPLKYAQVTSRFGVRRHPVHGTPRGHQGVDYAAPEGTPVWAVADGVVARAGARNGCGLSLTLRHRNGLSTEYCHLSRVDVKAGEKVAQKQVVGATGRSGVSTGSHLHFALRRGKAFVNPLSLKPPRESPVPEKLLPEFARAVAPLQAALTQGSVVAR